MMVAYIALFPPVCVCTYNPAFNYIVGHIKVESQDDFSLICFTNPLPPLSVAFHGKKKNVEVTTLKFTHADLVS